MIRITISALLLFLLFPLQASAIERYMASDVTCATIQSALDRDGAVVLYRRSETGMPRYDRYVKSRRFCQMDETAVRASIATSDQASCQLQRCRRVSRNSFGP